MYKKTSFRPKIIGGWDDSPERVFEKQKKTISAKKQIQGLINPGKMIDQVFGPRKTAETSTNIEQEVKTKKREFTLFSYSETRQDKQIVDETKEILEQLKEQIVLLQKSEKALSHDVSKIKVEQIPQKSGLYYLRFFEWLITTVKQLRMKADEGRAWLKTFTSRKKKRLGYWQMYKKHGTTFGLSHERTTATQVG